MTPSEFEVLQTEIRGLHQLMEEKFKNIQLLLANFQSGLEKLAENAVTQEAYQHQAEQLKNAQTTLQIHDRRLDKIESFMRPIAIVGSVAGAVLIAVLVALATGKAYIAWH